jgi:hypothetical protein
LSGDCKALQALVWHLVALNSRFLSRLLSLAGAHHMCPVGCWGAWVGTVCTRTGLCPVSMCFRRNGLWPLPFPIGWPLESHWKCLPMVLGWHKKGKTKTGVTNHGSLLGTKCVSSPSTFTVTLKVVTMSSIETGERNGKTETCPGSLLRGLGEPRAAQVPGWDTDLPSAALEAHGQRLP